MVSIRLPDGSQRQFEGPVTVVQVAANIGAGLAKAALAGKRRLDLVGGGARAADLKRQLGVAFEQAELSSVGQQRLGLDAVDEEIAGEVRHRL